MTEFDTHTNESRSRAREARTEWLETLAVAAAEEHAMFSAGTAVVVMVSGGADSTALLHLFAAGVIAPGCTLRVLHVDHMLRDESAEDAAFVAKLAESLAVDVRIVRYDVGAYAAAEGLNLEDAGRRVRYRFAAEELDALCDATGVSPLRGRIATAHTLDDRVETVLMRLVAGAGPGAFAGIRPVRGRIVRPLIDARRDDVIAYLGRLGQSWREDATNADTSRLRSRIRHELLPLLRAMNPRFAEGVRRSATIAAEEDALLAEMSEAFARDFVERIQPPEPGALPELRFDRALMGTLTRPVARRTVRAALADAFPEAMRLEFEHVEALVDGLSSEGFARDLPGGLRAFGEYDTMVVSSTDEGPPPLAPALLEVPGTVDLGAAGSITAEEAAAGFDTSDPDTATIDADTIHGPLVVDSPREGDRLRPLGMEGTKKVSDLLVDAKVPRRARPVTPVVRDGDAIVWVAGVRLSEDHRIRPGSRRALRLSWRRP